MNSLRQTAQGFFAKLIILFLVGCFVIWGIGDVFRMGFGSGGNVATVGGTGISRQEYETALRRRLEEVREMLGKNYTPEMAKKLGIREEVLNHLIDTLILDKETESLGIEVGDDDIARAIADNPAFHNDAGHFDKNVYLITLRNNGISEKHYVESLRREMAGKLIFGTLVSGVTVPQVLAEALYKARAEQRTANLLVIAPGALSALPAPTEKDIETYYNAHHDAFMAPELRSVSYVELKLAEVQTRMDVSEDDIKRAYAERAQDLRQPEKRVLEQMLFANEAAAKAASTKLAQGRSFAEVAKSAPILNKGKIALGALSRQSVPAQAADAVFALKEGASSAPVETPFGWHIFHVVKIEPEGVAKLDSVRADIIRDLKSKAAQETLYKLVGDLEDTLAGGSTLEKSAEKVGEKVHTIGPMTHEGLSADGKKLALPPYENFLSIAFATADKDHSQATQASDGSYFLLRVDNVTPEHLRSLAEVKDQVIAGWKEEKKQQQLVTKAMQVAADLRAGKPLAAALSRNHITAQAVTSGRLKRESETVPEGTLAGRKLPRAMVLELFTLKPPESTQAYAWPAGGEVIATLTQVIPAPPVAKNAAALESIGKELKGQMEDETLEEYLTYLRGKYEVSIDKSALGSGDDSE